MPLREYRCDACGASALRQERWDDAGPQVCEACGAFGYRRVLFAPQVLVKGGRLVDEDRRLVRPRVIRNPDGTETVYASVGEAQRGELDRVSQVTGSSTAQALLAAKNARAIVSGMVPGRLSTAYRQALEEPRR